MSNRIQRPTPKRPKVFSLPSQVARRCGWETDNPLEFFDVKFYPYNPPGAPPIFAATSKKHVSAAPYVSIQVASDPDLKAQVVICRLSQPPDKETNPCEVIQVIRDDDVSWDPFLV